MPGLSISRELHIITYYVHLICQQAGIYLSYNDTVEHCIQYFSSTLRLSITIASRQHKHTNIAYYALLFMYGQVWIILHH